MSEALRLPEDSELKHHASRPEVLDAVVAQLNKDLGSQSQTIEFDGPAEKAYQILKDELSRILGRWLRGDTTFLKAFLYRVDVSERAINGLLAKETNEEFEDMLATEVLNRELKKVLIRLHFGKP
ncbi:MAG: hypothetical protein KDD36_07000 [Flavobacteriales bacterium]|nr:hypothetical protein [Flavobacteriales bacterium]